MHGWMGKILRINLSSLEYSIEELDYDFVKKYLGGRGFGVAWVYERGVVEPFSPDNLLVFATGPLTLTRAQTAGRFSAVSRSPLTGTIFDSNSGGFFGAQLKASGFDAIIIDGASKHPVELIIDDGNVSIVESKNWGKNLSEIEPPKGFSFLAIGKAGESLLPLASIMVDRRDAFGRGGLGAVMGSKKLKAIFVRGRKRPSIANPDLFEEYYQAIKRWVSASSALMNLKNFGTAAILSVVQWMEILPTSNFRKSVFDEYENISGDVIRKKYRPKNHACYGCPIACKKSTKDGTELPEFETLALLGSACDNSNYESIVTMNKLCNDYGVDTISLGATIACLSEIEGRKIRPDELVELVKKTCKNEGIGAQLALGAKRFAELKGKPEAAMHVKGLELPGYDPRGVKGMALGYGTSNRGGCHLRAYMVSPEILRKPKAIDRTTLAGKPGYLYVFQNRFAYVDSLVLCKFLFFAVADDEISHITSAVTGAEFTVEELMKIGERIWNLERLYNLACGFTRKDDFLPERFYKESSTDSPIGQPINKDEYASALAEYYVCRGWDAEGKPSEKKLQELGIEAIPKRAAA